MIRRPKHRECHLCRMNRYQYKRAVCLCRLRFPNGYEPVYPLCHACKEKVKMTYLVEWEMIRLHADDTLQLNLFEL